MCGAWAGVATKREKGRGGCVCEIDIYIERERAARRRVGGVVTLEQNVLMGRGGVFRFDCRFWGILVISNNTEGHWITYIFNGAKQKLPKNHLKFQTE